MKERIHLRADSADGIHTWITVFCNGANCGQLCMAEEEALFFHQVVLMSTYAREGEVVSSGRWTKETQDETAPPSA